MINNTQPVLTVEDLFSKYLPERGTPLSADLIYWANRFGNTIEPSEEAIFRSEMLNKYGIDIAGDGGDAAMGSPSAGLGQGISSTAQSIGLGLMGVPAIGPTGMVANAIGSAVAGQQADAIADSFGAMAAAPDPSTGIATVSDVNGNISTVSTPGTVAAADMATFGAADAAAPGSDVSGAADEGSHGADGNNSGEASDDSDAAAAADASDSDGSDGDGDYAHGGAVRRFDVGGNQGRAELRATPQSPFLGKVASALKSLQEMAGQYQVLPQVPLLGGTGVDELLGLPGAAREVENWSYGNYPIRINPNAGRTASYIPEVKPGRKSDLADTVLLGLDVAPLASLAKTGVVRAARSAPAQAIDRMVREGYERGVIPAPGMTIKPKGGNWMAGTIDDSTRQFRQSPDWLSGEAINEAAGENLWSRMVDEGGHRDPHGWLRANRPDLYDKMVGPEGTAINRWLDTKLNKYIRNEMGTPDDPVKALAERGVLHFQPQGIRDQSPIMDKLRVTRQVEGFPAEGTATTPLGQQWERYSDYAIEPRKAGNIQSQAERGAFTVDRESAQRAIEENPWIAKLDPEAKVYGARWSSFDEEGLGFPHLIDELKNAMDPNSTLPRNLRIDPKDIDKITVPQAVERVSKINAWRAEEAAKAEKAGMLENLKATPRMADDSFELSFVEKPGGAWVDIPETVDEKGMKLCSSIGKAGGWCTQQEWAARSYGSGENRLTALVDTEGRPHAQAKISTRVPDSEAMELGDVLDPEEALADQLYRNVGQILADRGFGDAEDLAMTVAAGAERDLPQAAREMLTDVWAEAERMLPKKDLPKPDITELKPVGNSFSSERAQEYAKRDPNYFRKVENSVLKFLNSGEWGKVADLHHYGIVDLKDTNSLVDAMKTLYGDESSRRVGQEFVDAFNYALETTPDAPRFMTQRQLRDFIGPVEPIEGYAGGGVVKSIGKLVQKYLAKEAPEAAKEAAVKEQKMLQGFYRGYAGDYDAARAAAQDAGVFVSPQRAVGEYYASKRAGQTGLEPHLEMILADPFVGRNYGHATRGTGKNPPMVTRARELAPEDVKERTPLYAEGGLVNYDPDEIAQIAERATQGFAAGGLVHYDPNEIDTIVSQLKEEFHA